MTTRAVHVWDEHDTWWSVAARYTGSGLNWVHIALANQATAPNPRRVPVGARITIPEL